MHQSVASLQTGEDVKPYKIHVSSKYLELTKKKLELTRLPHELLLPKSQEWNNGTPKSAIEPLIDYWLESYSWRDQERKLNAGLPQFRTAFSLPASPPSPSPTPIRVHFVHARSPHPDALPLLLLPPFPLTNFALLELVAPLTNPPGPSSAGAGAGAAVLPAFHVVVPSLPGLGFSDALADASSAARPLAATARLFRQLMLRLGYAHFLCSVAGSGSRGWSSGGFGGGCGPSARIDYHLARLIAADNDDDDGDGDDDSDGSSDGATCRGLHLVDPPLPAPALASSPWQWLAFAVAAFFHAPVLGYAAADFACLSRLRARDRGRDRGRGRRRLGRGRRQTGTDDGDDDVDDDDNTGCAGNGSSPFGSVARLGLLRRQPDTLAYALCDSPVGLLSIVVACLLPRPPPPRPLAPPPPPPLPLPSSSSAARTATTTAPGRGGSSQAADAAAAIAPADIIDVAQLAWLPGPEAALRFWAAATEEEPQMDGNGRGGGGGGGGTNSSRSSSWVRSWTRGWGGNRSSTPVGVTVFLGDDDSDDDNDIVGQTYCPPAWAACRHNLAWTSRVPGRPGLLLSTSGEEEHRKANGGSSSSSRSSGKQLTSVAVAVIDGVRGLAAELAPMDARLRSGRRGLVADADAVIGAGTRREARVLFEEQRREEREEVFERKAAAAVVAASSLEDGGEEGILKEEEDEDEEEIDSPVTVTAL